VDGLNASLAKIFSSADTRARLSALGADPQTNTPREFAQALTRERAKWARIVKESGARAE
jgi:tripartite-type tricarboxylate transporter receptor subunit TctC